MYSARATLLLGLFIQFSMTLFVFFFFNDTATTEIYTLSLHDALPISCRRAPTSRRRSSKLARRFWSAARPRRASASRSGWRLDRKSTRLNSSHGYISYAVFCLKKKKKNQTEYEQPF